MDVKNDMNENWPTEVGRHVRRISISGHDVSGAQAETALTVIVCNGRRPGPCFLVTGGVHGDEYEGPAAIWRVANEIDAEQLEGSLILVPVLNPPAIEARRRRGPVDDLDLNRSFPGEVDGPLTRSIAAFVASALVPRADVVLDLHAGGEIEEIIPSLMVHPLVDKEATERAIAFVDAFGAPIGVVIDESRKEGMFDTFVEDQGKLFACAELGGAGKVSQETIRISENGIWNSMIHLGMLPASEKRSAAAGKLCFGPSAGEITSDSAGFYEPIKTVGAVVDSGEVIGRLLDLADPLAPPIDIRAPIAGVLFIQCTGGHVEVNELVGHVIVDAGGATRLAQMARDYVGGSA